MSCLAPRPATGTQASPDKTSTAAGRTTSPVRGVNAARATLHDAWGLCAEGAEGSECPSSLTLKTDLDADREVANTLADLIIGGLLVTEDTTADDQADAPDRADEP